jgi:hypothetical protein
MTIGKGRARRWGAGQSDRRFRRQGRDLVQECGVYLSGHYADFLETRNEHVPNWAWINVLAQADPELLRSLVAENALSGGVRKRTSVWWQAIAFLAGEILSHQNDDRISTNCVGLSWCRSSSSGWLRIGHPSGRVNS